MTIPVKLHNKSPRLLEIITKTKKTKTKMVEHFALLRTRGEYNIMI